MQHIDSNVVLIRKALSPLFPLPRCFYAGYLMNPSYVEPDKIPHRMIGYMAAYLYCGKYVLPRPVERDEAVESDFFKINDIRHISHPGTGGCRSYIAGALLPAGCLMAVIVNQVFPLGFDWLPQAENTAAGGRPAFMMDKMLLVV